MGWAAAAPLIGSVASGLLGSSNAKEQNRAAERAAQPQPYSSDTTRSPWGPATGPLEEALEMARELFDRNSQAGGPPRISTSGITGASPRLRELADLMHQRATTSTFIPDMQSGLTNFLQGPNSMMQSTFDRASNYENPMLQALLTQGQGSGFNSSQGQMQGFLDSLLGGQTQLGAPPGPPPGMSPPGMPRPGMPPGGQRPGPGWAPPQGMPQMRGPVPPAPQMALPPPGVQPPPGLPAPPIPYK